LTGPVKMSHHIMWTDWIAAGGDPADINRQSTATLFALWKDLPIEQKHTKCKEGQANEKVKAWMLTLQDLWNKDRQDDLDIRVVGDPHDLQSHVELCIYWSPHNVQNVLTLEDTGAKQTLLFSNPKNSKGPQQ
jgi:hypothetical protein